MTIQQPETLPTLLQPHELADVFPEMPLAEFLKLKADIAANGLLEPVWLYHGQILDGRHRYRACSELGKECDFQEYAGDTPVQFVFSKNLQRRNLSSSQRAVVAMDIEPYLAEEAKERQKTGKGTDGSGGRGNKKVNLPELIPEGLPKTDNSNESRDHAAQVVGTNPHYVTDAKRFKVQAPDLIPEVRKGKLTITQAMRELNKRNTTPPPPIAGKYRVFYADPPWQYGNSGVITEADNYGRAARHYPSMSIAELCEMGTEVRNASEGNAVLFMWVTAPLLGECFEVTKAWGFTYKSQYVWNKERHNFAHYSSLRHENLLVCTRGSCIPDGPAQQINSIQSIKRSDRHSEKPAHFRELIDILYPHGNRIELFAREKTASWDAWGNQVAEVSGHR